MDLIRIDDNKMKIMLTSVDMQSYSLDTAEMDGNRTETHPGFRHLMDDVRTRTGFDAQGNKIYVQLYPSREGGCEMFVTKLGMVCALGEPVERPSIGADRTAHTTQSRVQRLPEGERRRSIAFVFEALEHLLFVCKRLQSQTFPGGSAAYRGEEGRYYLLLTESSRTSDTVRVSYGPILDRRSLSFISEYGMQQNAETVRLYIREHGCPICENDAVARLAVL